MASLEQAAIRQRLLDRMQILMNSMTDAVESLKTRLAGASQSGGVILSQEQADALATRLGALQNTTDAEIQAAWRAPDVLGSTANITDDMVSLMRAWINRAQSSPGVSSFASLSLRTNSRLGNSTEAAIMGSFLSGRKSLAQAGIGRFLFVIDENGAVWLGNLDQVYNHSALVPANAQVRAAGEIRICQNGDVFVNTRSGHYMSGQMLSQAERPMFVSGMNQTICEAGLTPRAVYTDITDVFQLGS